MILRRLLLAFTVAVFGLLGFASTVGALGLPDPEQSGSFGLQGRISAAPPTQAPTITTPNPGQTFDDSPIDVAGLCNGDLLVKVFDNNVFVGATVCNGGSYSLQVSLFSGQNDLIARMYDSLDQAGPSSNMVSVTFNDAFFAQFGTQLTLTSQYARIGANPGTLMTWPVILSGGSGPYALSVDWGDSSGNDLISRNFAGEIDLKHAYSSSGIYPVIVKATDSNGGSAYLQLIAVANGEGAVINQTGEPGPTIVQTGTQLRWYFFIPILPLLILAFWLGGRNELYVIRRRLENARQAG